jgi:hypothetical protein
MIVRDFMKIAVIGSRGIVVRDLENYLPEETTEIVSGGARGVDTSARYYAQKNGLKLTEFFPDYDTYGKIAPLMRNLEIIDYADEVYAFWDGISRGTKYVIENCRRKKKKVHVFMLKKLDENDF